MTKFQKRQNPTIAGASTIPEKAVDTFITDGTTDRLTLLKAARDRQEQELTDLQAQMDELSDDFAERAERIVRLGLQSSYIKARQRIGAIDLSFFDNGDALPPETINFLPEAIEV